MHPVKLLMIALAVVLPAADAACFKTGQSWGSPANRQRAVTDLNGVCGQLAHSYPSGETDGHCVNSPEGISFQFSVKHVSANNRNLGKAECIDGLSKEIRNCDRGGKTKADPNAGPC